MRTPIFRPLALALALPLALAGCGSSGGGASASPGGLLVATAHHFRACFWAYLIKVVAQKICNETEA